MELFLLDGLFLLSIDFCVFDALIFSQWFNTAHLISLISFLQSAHF